MLSTKVGRGLGLVANWLGAPLRCKIGDHEWVKTVDPISDSPTSTLKLTCLRCPRATKGIQIGKEVRNEA